MAKSQESGGYTAGRGRTIGSGGAKSRTRDVDRQASAAPPMYCDSCGFNNYDWVKTCGRCHGSMTRPPASVAPSTAKKRQGDARPLVRSKTAPAATRSARNMVASRIPEPIPAPVPVDALAVVPPARGTSSALELDWLCQSTRFRIASMIATYGPCPCRDRDARVSAPRFLSLPHEVTTVCPAGRSSLSGFKVWR